MRIFGHGLLSPLPFSLSPSWRRCCYKVKVPRRNSSSASSVLNTVNVAFGNCFQTTRSSDVIVSQPNLYIYRHGSVTPPTCAHVTCLLAAASFTFPLSPARPQPRPYR